eukprot:TRINITY_DN10502_c0_g1_i3.p1 TRINITY_DN10502_c0_g1~~TRINITY_DN10502_c0_g1_i3.p1  ORF type:complete len:657 (+),score=115.21 TRINITY_DN10502_c0_g1_i3:84-2054(+)
MVREIEIPKDGNQGNCGNHDFSPVGFSVRGIPVQGRLRSAGRTRKDASPVRAWVRPASAASFAEHTKSPASSLRAIQYDDSWEPSVSLEVPASLGSIDGDFDRMARVLAEQQAAHETRIARLIEGLQKTLLDRLAPLPGTAQPRSNDALAGGSARRQSGQAESLLEFVPVDDVPLHRGGSAKSVLDGAQGRALAEDEDVAGQQFDKQQDVLDSIKQELGRNKSREDLVARARKRFSLGSDDGTKGMCLMRWIGRIVGSPLFETLSCACIVANAITIGVELDFEFEVLAKGEGMPPAFRILNLFFVIAFTVELLMRIIAEGRSFLAPTNSAFSWNAFDMILVLSSWLEEVLSHLAVNADMSVMRLFRTVRLVRSFRIIRVFKVFRDLRVMLQGILSSIRSLVWALFLLVAIQYLVAVCLLQFASAEIEAKTVDPSSGVLDADQYGQLQDYFGSLAVAMYTLFLSIAGGIDWGDAAAPMLALGTPLGILFCMYIAFAVLCVLNIITGVFVENANRLCSTDEEMVLLEQMEERRKWFAEVRCLFESADEESDGTIDASRFIERMKDVRMQAWMRKLGVQVEAYTAEALFHLLDFDGDGLLGFDEFAEALESIHGSAKSIDIAKIKKDTKTLRSDMERLIEIIKSRFDVGGLQHAAKCLS